MTTAEDFLDEKNAESFLDGPSAESFLDSQDPEPAAEPPPPEVPEPITSGAAPDSAKRFVAGVAQNTADAAAGALYALDEMAQSPVVMLKGKPFSEANAFEYQGLEEDLNDLRDIQARTVEGGGGLPDPKERSILKRMQELENDPGKTRTLEEAAKFMREVSANSRGTYGVDPARDSTLLGKVASGAGSIIPAMASGPAAPATVAAMMGEQGRKDAEDLGATPEQQRASFYLNAGVGALSEALLGIPALLRSAKAARIPAATYREMAKASAREAAKSVLREGAQEGIEQLAQNIIAAKIVGYEQGRPLTQGVGEAVLVGGIIGAPVGGIAGAAETLPVVLAKKKKTAAVEKLRQVGAEAAAQAAEGDQKISEALSTVQNYAEEHRAKLAETLGAAPAAEPKAKEIPGGPIESAPPEQQSKPLDVLNSGNPHLVDAAKSVVERIASGDLDDAQRVLDNYVNGQELVNDDAEQANARDEAVAILQRNIDEKRAGARQNENETPPQQQGTPPDPTGEAGTESAPVGEEAPSAIPPEVIPEPEPAVEDPAPEEESSELDKGEFPPMRVGAGEIAVRPDLMQFKRADDPKSGINDQEKLEGKWDDLKGGMLLLWEPANPEAHGLENGERYIVANGHHRFEFGARVGNPAYNAQILKEADGYTAEQARTIGAEINIADGKGSIYDQAKFISNTAATFGADEALAAGRRVGARGRQAATIAIHATDSTFGAFINERISAAHAEAIAKATPGHEEAQMRGVQAALNGADAMTAANRARAQTLRTGPAATQTNLFGEEVFAEEDAAADRATAEQRRITGDIRAIQYGAKKPEVLAKYGIDVKDPEDLARKIAELKAELARWENWSMHPDLIRRALGLPADPATPPTDGRDPIASQTIPEATAVPPPAPDPTPAPESSEPPAESPKAEFKPQAEDAKAIADTQRHIDTLKIRMAQDKKRSITKPEDVARLKELEQKLAQLRAGSTPSMFAGDADPFNLQSETKAEREARLARAAAEEKAAEDEAARKAREEADRDQGRLFAPRGSLKSPFAVGSIIEHNGRKMRVTADRGTHVEAQPLDSTGVTLLIPRSPGFSVEEVRGMVRKALDQFEDLLDNVGHPPAVFSNMEPDKLMFVEVDRTGEPRIYVNWQNLSIDTAGLSETQAAAEIQQAIFSEIVHVAQIRFADENPELTNAFNDWISNPENPDFDPKFDEFMRNAYDIWPNLRPFQKTAEAARVIIEQRWHGRITEQASKYLKGLLDWLKRWVFSLEERPAYVRQYIADVENVLNGRPRKLVEGAKEAGVEMDAQLSEFDNAWQRASEGDNDALNDLDRIKERRYGRAPTGRPGEARPPRFYTTEEFERFFNQAFAVKDFDAILDAVKASDVSIYGPLLKRLFRAQATDPEAAAKADWLRAVFNGTRPVDARAPSPGPGPAPKTPPPTPPPTGKASPPPGGSNAQTEFDGMEPPPAPVPPRPTGKSPFNMPALVYLARRLGALPTIDTVIKRARGYFRDSAGTPSIGLHAHLFKNPEQAAKTLAHEIGHLFDWIPESLAFSQLAEKVAPLKNWRAIFGPTWDWSGHKISRIQAILKSEAKGLSAAWRGPFSDTDSYRNSADELYADFISALLNDPEWTFTAAPNLSAAFFAGIEQKPDVEEAYNVVNALLRTDVLLRALREEQKEAGQSGARRIISETVARIRESVLLRRAWAALQVAAINRHGPTASKAGGYFKSTWDRHQHYGYSYTDQQEDAATFADRNISIMHDRLKAGTFMPMQAKGIGWENLDTYLRNRRIIHEDTATGLYLQSDPDEARTFLGWMAEAAGMGPLFQDEINNASDAELRDLGARIIQRIHERQLFEQVYRRAQRKDAPAYAERGLFAFDVSGYMLNPQGIDPINARAELSQIEKDLGPDSFDTLEQAAQNYYDVMGGIMQDAYKLGLIRPEHWTERIQPNLGNYVPFMVLDYFTGHADASMRARDGTAKDILPTHLAGQLKAAAILRRMQRQKQALILQEFFQQEGAAFGFGSEMTLHDELSDQEIDQLKKERGLMGYYDRGVWRWMEFQDKATVSALEQFDPDDLAPVMYVLRQHGVAWRLYLTTYSVAFTVFNAFRTARTAFESHGRVNLANLARVYPQARAYANAIVNGTPLPPDLQRMVLDGVLPAPEHSLAGQLEPNQVEQMILSGIVSARHMTGDFPAQAGNKIIKAVRKLHLGRLLDSIAWISGVVESSPKIAAFKTLTEKGAPIQQAAAYARLEGIPNPGISGKYNKAMELVLMFARVHIQGLRAQRTRAFSTLAPNESMTRGGWLTRAVLSQFIVKGLYVAAAAGIIDKLLSPGAGDDERQRDFEEFVKRSTPYKLEMDDLIFLGWIKPSGGYALPFGHNIIPSDWTPFTIRIPHSEDGRYVSPFAALTTSTLAGSDIRPVQPGYRAFQLAQSVVPGSNPGFDTVRAAWASDNDFPPQDDYRGQPMVPRDEWQAGPMSRSWGIAKHFLTSAGIPGFTKSVENPDLAWFWKLTRSTPVLGRMVPLDNYGGVREMLREQVENQEVNAKANNMRGDETKAAMRRITSLRKKGGDSSSKEHSRTRAENAEYKVLSDWHYRNYEQNMGVLKAKAAGIENVDAAGAIKHLEQTAKDAREAAREAASIYR